MIYRHLKTCAHDLPEPVMAISIILMLFQGSHAGHGPQDQHIGRFRNDGIKTDQHTSSPITSCGSTCVTLTLTKLPISIGLSLVKMTMPSTPSGASHSLRPRYFPVNPS